MTTARVPPSSGEHLLRDLAPQVLGAVVRRFRDFAAAEDAVQEALSRRRLQWPREGVPDNPRAWLIQVAIRRMTDHLRSEAGPPAPRDHRSRLEAHLTPRSRRARQQRRSRTTRSSCSSCAATLRSRRPSAIALTLRAVGGLTTAEIASAFLVPEATMAQRISRAKQSIKSSGVPFRMPTEQRARASGSTPSCTCST